MTDPTPRKNARKTPEGRPFQPGNPGRPKGARHKTTLAMEALLDGEGETLTRKAIEMAKAGDLVALRLCLDRLLPPRRDRAVQFDLPELNTPADAVQAAAALVRAVADGEITPTEAADLARLVEAFTKALDVHEIDVRLKAVESKLEK